MSGHTHLMVYMIVYFPAVIKSLDSYPLSKTVRGAYIEIRTYSLQEVKNNIRKIIEESQPQKWLWSVTEGGHL